MLFRERMPKGPLTGRRCHSTDRVLFRHVKVQRIEACELFGAVWACILDFEVNLIDVSR